MKALSIRAPWWWFILHAGKTIENRGWCTSWRGPLLIHASAWWRPRVIDDDWDAAIDMASAAGIIAADAWRFADHKATLYACRGCLVGTAELADCIDRSDSPWFAGRYGLVLANARPLAAPIIHKGALGLFHVPDHLLPPEARS